MANLIEAADIQPGMDIWEEWRFGTTSIRVSVERVTREYIFGVWHWPTGDVPMRERRTKEYRYWDGEPSIEERQFTPWRKG